MKKVNVALVGLAAFGSKFVPIYLDHPNVGTVGIFDLDTDRVKQFKEKYPQLKTYSSWDEILNDTTVDAVHLLTPIPIHADQSVAVLESGKHCACAVPMATSLDDIQRIVDATRKSGKNYMMMETTLYTYQFFYVKEMIETGKLGRIQFLRGSHYQDMSRWPGYWTGLPPMWYGTHAIGPLVALSDSRIKRVVCFGSGTMDESLHQQYGNPYPIESALFDFENGMKAEATRSLFETARISQEGFFVYGSDASLEWGFSNSDHPYITIMDRSVNVGERGIKVTVEQMEMPNYHYLLPESIQKYTVARSVYNPEDPQGSLAKGRRGDHHGSHPHLVHEFVMSIIENRKPWIDENLSANITAAGICAHESAMKNGESVIIPTF